MHKKLLISATVLFALTILTGCGKKSAPITDCSPVDGLRPICQFHNPEDFEVLPDGKTLIVSQMGNFTEKKPGDLALFNTETERKTVVFPQPDIARTNESWGDATCPGIPGNEFTPHGIALKQRTDGRWQLAVVNHGKRETVEMFEIIDHGDRYDLQWHGCAVLPAGIFMNDLALLHNGHFVASNMFDPRKPEIGGMSVEMYKGLLGMNTGYVFEWTPGQGIRILEGSHSDLPNGVEASTDDNTVFVSSSGANVVLKFDRATGKLLGSAPVQQPDNLSWDRNGQLLVAGYGGNRADQMECAKKPGSNCSGAIDIERIDPDTMQTSVALKHAGPPIGTASIARQVGEQLYIGSFTGDRIVAAPYEFAAHK